MQIISKCHQGSGWLFKTHKSLTMYQKRTRVYVAKTQLRVSIQLLNDVHQ